MAISMGEKARGVFAEMNVVPLIDILLVLVILFMVISPLASRGHRGLLPQQGPATSNEGIVVLQVGAGGALRINQEPVAWDELVPRISRIFRDRVHKVVFVRGDAPALFEDVARAIDLLRRAGIEKVGLLSAQTGAGRS